MTPLRAIHLALVGVLAWLACILAWPTPTFPTGLSYREFAALAPEWVWAVIFAAAAVIGALERDENSPSRIWDSRIG